MKKLLLGTVTGILLISCNSGGSGSNDSQAEKNRLANRDIYKGIETGDTSKFAIISKDGVDHNGGPNGGEIKGQDSIKWYLTDMHRHFDNLKFDIISDAANGDYVYALVRMTGTAKDASMGFPSGTKIDMQSVDVLKYKDGMATDHWGYVDPNDMMKMMQGMQHTNPADSTKK